MLLCNRPHSHRDESLVRKRTIWSIIEWLKNGPRESFNRDWALETRGKTGADNGVCRPHMQSWNDTRYGLQLHKIPGHSAVFRPRRNLIKEGVSRAGDDSRNNREDLVYRKANATSRGRRYNSPSTELSCLSVQAVGLDSKLRPIHLTTDMQVALSSQSQRKRRIW